MTGRAFAPAHISGFFVIDLKTDLSRTGSLGCGICLRDGVASSVSLADQTSVRINGKEIDAPTTMSVLKRLTHTPLSVETITNVPVGCGFGASGAGALSTALAANQALGLKRTLNQLADIAHIAEVENRTGLGDVIAQTFGGVVIRKKAGSPTHGMIDRIPCGELEISWIAFGKISTSSIISDPHIRKRINRAGKSALKELLRKPALENFMEVSKKFSLEIGLMGDKVRDVIDAVESAGGLGSQAMLGEAVFAIGGEEALKEFGETKKSIISHAGAHYI